jgi:hypothetical protein
VSGEKRIGITVSGRQPPRAHSWRRSIYGELGVENRGDATEQGSARVGGELGIGDLAVGLRRAEGLALKKAVGIAHAAFAQGEAMQHCQPVEPVIIAARAHFEF